MSLMMALYSVLGVIPSWRYCSTLWVNLDWEGDFSARPFRRSRFGAADSALRLFGAADSAPRPFGAETIRRRDDSALADSAQAISATGRFGTGRFGAGTFRRNLIFLAIIDSARLEASRNCPAGLETSRNYPAGLGNVQKLPRRVRNVKKLPRRVRPSS